MAPDDDASGLYQAPGCEMGLFVVPAVAVVALIAGLAVAVMDGPWNGVVVGFVGFVVGIVAWFGLWELFVRLHPRFSQGRGEDVKWFLVVLGPPLVTVAAVVLLAIELRPR